MEMVVNMDSDPLVTLTLSERDLQLVRSALQELLATYTRHEHVLHEIKDLLRRLPDGQTVPDERESRSSMRRLTL